LEQIWVAIRIRELHLVLWIVVHDKIISACGL